MTSEKQYNEVSAFYDFASTKDEKLDQRLEKWKHKEELFKLCKNDKLLARAIFYIASENAINYMNSKIPALNNRTPVECVKTKSGLKKLKECILRTP